MFSTEYLNLLKEFEGYYEKPYLCPAGKCTIGYGTNLEAHRKFIPYEDIRNGNLTGSKLKAALINRGMAWSKEEAEKAMITELTETHKDLYKRCSTYRTLLDKGENVRAEVLLDMAYNMGVGIPGKCGLLSFKNTLAKIEAGNYSGGAAGMRASKWFKQVGRRSRALVKAMETGKFPTELK